MSDNKVFVQRARHVCVSLSLGILVGTRWGKDGVGCLWVEFQVPDRVVGPKLSGASGVRKDLRVLVFLGSQKAAQTPRPQIILALVLLEGSCQTLSGLPKKVQQLQGPSVTSLPFTRVAVSHTHH